MPSRATAETIAHLREVIGHTDGGAKGLVDRCRSVFRTSMDDFLTGASPTARYMRWVEAETTRCGERRLPNSSRE